MTRVLTAIAFALIFCSCHSVTGSGNIQSETRNTDQFDGVKASGSIDVEVVNDYKQLVKVEADDNVLQYVVTTVKEGMLNVHLKNNQMYHNINVKVYVSVPSLRRLFVSGSGGIISKDTLRDEQHISFSVSGSGNIEAYVDAPAINAEVSGSGSLKLKGRTKDLTSNVSGSGDLKCNELLSENTTVKVSGSGTAHVFASVNLNAKVSGSGDVFYKGNPTHPVIHKSGSGSVSAEK